MASPFCTACGAGIVPGNRFCVKCGQPVAASPPVNAPVDPVAPPAPPVAPVPTAQFTPTPPPPMAVPQVTAAPVPPQALEASSSSGAALWIGLIGILLLLGGVGLWIYMKHAAPKPVVVDTATAVPAPLPVETVPAPVTPVEAPKPEVIPPNPDNEKPEPVKAPKPVPTRPVPTPVPTPASRPPALPAPPPPVAAAPTSGVLHASVEVMQDGEVVFENLPKARLKFTFDRSAWKPTIHRQPNGTQTLVMRSLKPGVQRSCDVKWEIVE